MKVISRSGEQTEKQVEKAHLRIVLILSIIVFFLAIFGGVPAALEYHEHAGVVALVILAILASTIFVYCLAFEGYYAVWCEETKKRIAVEQHSALSEEKKEAEIARLQAVISAFADRRKAREAVGRLLATGNELMVTINRSDGQMSVVKEVQDWMDRAAIEIGNILDSSYVARFHSPAGSGPVEAAPTPKNLLLAPIRFRLMRLQEFLAELASQ